MEKTQVSENILGIGVLIAGAILCASDNDLIGFPFLIFGVVYLFCLGFSGD